MLKHLALLAVALLAVGHCSSADDNLKRVLTNYDKSKPPSGNQSTTVKVGLYMSSIDLDDSAKRMQISMYFRQTWNDSRLSGLGDDSVRLMDLDKIWLPDTFIRNDEKNELAPGEISDNFRLLKVSRGNVWYAARLTGSISCLTRTSRYPKDAPVCHIYVESFGYKKDVMSFEFMDNPISIDVDSFKNVGMYLFDTILSDCSVNYTGGSFPCLDFTFLFQRAVSLQFFTVVYLPSAVIVLVSTSSFWIQADKPTPRLLVGLLTTLTVTLHAAAVRLYYVSTVTEMTLLDLWLIGCVLVVFVAFVLQLAGVVIAGLRAKNRSESTKVEATAAESSGSKPVTFITDLVGKIAIPVLFVLLIIIYAAV